LKYSKAEAEYTKLVHRRRCSAYAYRPSLYTELCSI